METVSANTPTKARVHNSSSLVVALLGRIEVVRSLAKPNAIKRSHADNWRQLYRCFGSGASTKPEGDRIAHSRAPSPQRIVSASYWNSASAAFWRYEVMVGAMQMSLAQAKRVGSGERVDQLHATRDWVHAGRQIGAGIHTPPRQRTGRYADTQSFRSAHCYMACQRALVEVHARIYNLTPRPYQAAQALSGVAPARVMPIAQIAGIIETAIEYGSLMFRRAQ